MPTVDALPSLHPPDANSRYVQLVEEGRGEVAVPHAERLHPTREPHFPQKPAGGVHDIEDGRAPHAAVRPNPETTCPVRPDRLHTEVQMKRVDRRRLWNPFRRTRSGSRGADRACPTRPPSPRRCVCVAARHARTREPVSPWRRRPLADTSGRIRLRSLRPAEWSARRTCARFHPLPRQRAPTTGRRGATCRPSPPTRRRCPRGSWPSRSTVLRRRRTSPREDIRGRVCRTSPCPPHRGGRGGSVPGPERGRPLRRTPRPAGARFHPGPSRRGRRIARKRPRA